MFGMTINSMEPLQKITKFVLAKRPITTKKYEILYLAAVVDKLNVLAVFFYQDILHYKLFLPLCIALCSTLFFLSLSRLLFCLIVENCQRENFDKKSVACICRTIEYTQLCVVLLFMLCGCRDNERLLGLSFISHSLRLQLSRLKPAR